MTPPQKERIIDQAMQMFATQGIKSVRMDDIAQHLGVSKRTLYELFGDKEGLLYLAMERYIPGTDETELDWQRMWKRFFKALTIEQRRDEKAQMSHVPKRFWQDMCEMQPDLAFPAGAAVRKAD